MASREKDVKQNIDSNAAQEPQESLFIRLINEFRKPEYEPLIAFTKLALKNGKNILSEIARDLMKPYDWAKRITNLPEQYQGNRNDGYSIPASVTATGAGIGATISMGYVATSFYKAAQIAAVNGARSTPYGLVALAVLTAVQTEKAQKLANDLVRSGVDAILPGSELKERKEESEALNLSLSSVEFEQYISELQNQLNNLLMSTSNSLAKKIDTKEDAMAASADAMKQNSGNSDKAKGKDEKLTQEKKKVSELKKQAEGIVVTAQKDNFALTEELTEKIKTFAETLGYTGLFVNEVSQAAIKLGGHERTWRDIASRGMGAYKVCAGFAVVSTPGGAPLGAMMMFNGLMEMISGAQESSAYEEIFHALAEIRGILIQGLNQLSRQISDNFNQVLIRLHKMSFELDRLEPLISSSFKEIHIKELVDIIDEIKKGLDGEFSLADDEKRKCLRRLSTWIDHHSKAKIQTSLLRDSKDTSKCLELLKDDNFNLSTQFPFFILQLVKVLPSELFKNIDLNDLPNLTVLKDACEIFVLLINHYQFQDNYLPTLQRAQKSFQSMNDIIKQIKENSEIWDILFRQYNDFRYKVGRAIFKCRNEQSLKKDLALEEQLKASSNAEHLMHLLDQMEMRRIILQRLAELTECYSLTFDKIQLLDTKSDILKRKGEFYQNYQNQFLTYAANEQFLEFRKSIENGANINTWDTFGQAIHYISRERGKNYSDAIKLLHELFKSNKELSACYSGSPGTFVTKSGERGAHGSRSVYRTWGIQVLPITWMMNSGYFDLGMLYCAAGFDIRMDDIHFLNGLTWATKSQWRYYVQYYLVREMNDEKSFLNKKDLRKAYEYYKAIEAGISVSPDNISQDCLLWLTCILGDFKPLISLNKAINRENIYKAIPNTGFTPLMMSICCNTRNVSIWLMKALKEDLHDFCPKVEFDVETGSNALMHIAIKLKYYTFAKEMHDAGLKVTSDQLKKIEEGLKAVVPLNNEVAANNNGSVVPAVHQHPTSQTLLLIKTQLEQLKNEIEYLEHQPKPEVKQDKEKSTIKEKLKRPIVFSAMSLNDAVRVSNEISNNDFLRTFGKCKTNFTLLNNFVLKSKQEKEAIQSARVEMENLKVNIAKVDSLISSDNSDSLKKAIPLLQKIEDSFDTIDGILKSDSDLQYSLGDNIHRMLSNMQDLLKRYNMCQSLKI